MIYVVVATLVYYHGVRGNLALILLAVFGDSLGLG